MVQNIVFFSKRGREIGKIMSKQPKINIIIFKYNYAESSYFIQYTTDIINVCAFKMRTIKLIFISLFGGSVAFHLFRHDSVNLQRF